MALDVMADHCLACHHLRRRSHDYQHDLTKCPSIVAMMSRNHWVAGSRLQHLKDLTRS